MRPFSFPFIICICLVGAFGYKGVSKKNALSPLDLHFLLPKEEKKETTPPIETPISQFFIHKIIGPSTFYELHLTHEHHTFSWMIPKGPSCNPYQKRVAYAAPSFVTDTSLTEGRQMAHKRKKQLTLVWDYGTLDMKDTDSTHLIFILNGKRLQGEYSIHKKEGKKWVLRKSKDAHAHAYKNITRLFTTSALSGKTARELMYTHHR